MLIFCTHFFPNFSVSLFYVYINTLQIWSSHFQILFIILSTICLLLELIYGRKTQANARKGMGSCPFD